MYICAMKKRTIIILGLIMGLSFVALLSQQVRYIEEIVKMRREQFDESVKRSLYNTAHRLELYETKRYLEKDVAKAEAMSPKGRHGIGVEIHQYDFRGSKDGVVSSFEMRTIIMPRRPQHEEKRDIPDASRSLQDAIRSRYVHQRALMDEHCRISDLS